MNATKPHAIHQPGEAAAILGVPLSSLVAMIRRHRYAFTEIAPGGAPGQRGRNRWGMTDSQIQAILKGQARAIKDPEPEPNATAPRQPQSPDGISRIPRRRPK